MVLIFMKDSNKMRLFVFFVSFYLLSSCSLNKNSNFWTEESIKKNKFKNKLETILSKSNDLISLSFEEYKIFINEYSKKSKYPDINK